MPIRNKKYSGLSLKLFLAGAALAILSPSAGAPPGDDAATRADPGTTTRHSRGIRVLDGKGHHLGHFLSLDPLEKTMLVHHMRLGAQLWISRHDGSLVNANGSIVYEQPECLGEPWAPTADSGRLQGPLAGSGEYFIVGSEAVDDRTFVSRRQIFGGCQNDVPPSVQNRTYSRVKFVALEDVGYTFPVALPVRISADRPD